MTIIARNKLISVIAGAFVSAVCTTSVHAETTVLKFSTMGGPSDPMMQCFTQPLLDGIVAASDGRIEIETYIGGSGFADPVRQYEQVARGVMDISQGVLSYTPGQFAMTEVATMPLLVDNAEDMSRALTKLAPEYLADEFEDIHLMAILATPALYIHQRDDLNGLDGLVGKRIRSTGAGANAFLESIGAIPVQLPTPSVYENLQTGTIDGALSESTALRSFRIGEVAENHLQVNVTSALLFLGMNRSSLEALPEDLQQIITTEFSGPEVGARSSACWNSLGADVVDDLKSEGQVFEPLSERDMARAQDIAASVTQDYIEMLEAQGKPATAFYDALVTELQSAGN